MITINTHAGREPGDPQKPLYTEVAETLEAAVGKLLSNRAGYHLVGRLDERPETLLGELVSAWEADPALAVVWKHDSNCWHLCDTLAPSQRAT